MHWAGAASSGQVELKASAARGIWGMPWPGCLGGMAGAGAGVLEHLKGMGYCWRGQGSGACWDGLGRLVRARGLGSYLHYQSVRGRQ